MSTAKERRAQVIVIGDKVKIANPFWQERKGQTGVVVEGPTARGLIKVRLDGEGTVTECGKSDVLKIA